MRSCQFAVLVFASIVALLAGQTAACGCYGPTSCSVRGIQCEKGIFRYMGRNDPCICDCCLPCNSCDQLLAGCARKPNKSIKFVPALHTLKVNKPIKPRTLQSTKHEGNMTLPLGLFGDPCLTGNLPAGLNLTYDEGNATFVLTGTPTEKGKTMLGIVAKGGGSVIYRVDVKITVK
ncbi:hypothetical protein HDU87_005771 [Geranomyces variabilis]|uniref:Uncharacterized protein n=1 Tax=Geranomyces variabilis TaxID=109894 RepID=A0AAD5XLH4_9FUNG|nr:hypothetical protein HDU87_005771 [Geranomyces variabilis]